MQINIEKGDLLSAKTELLVFPVYQDKDFDVSKVTGFPDELRSRFEKAAKAQGFVGRPAQHVLVQFSLGSGADELLVVGLGERTADTTSILREVCGGAFVTARRLGMKHITFVLQGKDNLKEEYVDALVTAAFLGNYSFHTFKQSNKDKHVDRFTVLIDDSKLLPRFRKAAERAEAIVDGVSIARDLVNTPAQDVTPTRLALQAEEIAAASNKMVKVKILDRKECAKLGMGAFLAVAQGSEEEPKFIHLTYTSPRPTKKSLALVGKGVTFDSGGLSIKPADSMMTMKCDMAGAAAVLGFFATLAKLKPRVNIHGVIAATENMLSGKAMRPGDVVKSMDGKTIEILNTDAEGRLTLADAMTYVLREKPDTMIDLATLTGAVVVALGEEIAGIMGNDRKLAQDIIDASKKVGEKFWELPLEERYHSLIVSEIADLRNIPTSRYGGTLTAGLFLQEFVGNTPWVHLDIAGPAFAERPMGSYLAKGGTGFGIRTLVELVRD